MKRKIVGIFVVTLLIATAVLPVVGIMNVDKTKLMENSISGGNEVKQDVVPENRERKILNRPFRSLLLPSWLLEIFNGDWDYWTNPPNMYAIPTGNVGIGTSNPTSELEVAGRIEADGFTINGIPVGTSTDSYWSAYEADLFYYGTITIGALDIEALNLRGVGDPPETPPGLLVKGDIIAEKGEHGTGNITARGHLKTEGNVTAKGHMKSEGNVTAKGHMKSEGNVTAKGHMKSEGNVTAKGHMKSEGNVTAGKDLIVGRWLKFLSVGMGIIFPDDTVQTTAFTGDAGSCYWVQNAVFDIFYTGGNVGIGIDSPTEKLTIVDPEPEEDVNILIGKHKTSEFGLLGWKSGGSTGQDSSYLWLGPQPNSDFHLILNPPDCNGNVGIGTTKPTAKLEVDGSVKITGPCIVDPSISTISPYIRLVSDNSFSKQAFIDFCNKGSSIWQVGSDMLNENTRNFVIYDSQAGAPRLYINNIGNVGIGTTNPQATLHVNDVLMLEPSSEPGSPEEGMIYYDEYSNMLKCYDGYTWQDLWS